MWGRPVRAMEAVRTKRKGPMQTLLRRRKWGVGQCVIGAQEEEVSRVVLRLQGHGTTVIRVRDGKVGGGTDLWGKLSNLVLDIC